MKLFAKTIKNGTYLVSECNVQVVELWECE